MAAGSAAGEAAAGVFDTLVTSWMNQQARQDEQRLQEEKARAVKNAAARANVTYDEMQGLLDQYNQNRIRIADDSTVQQYKQLMNEYEPRAYDFGKFGDTYTKTIDDFINPEADKIAELAGLKTQADLASRGAAKGTGGVAGIGYSKWEAAEQLYKDAQQALKDDRAQAYTEYGDYIDRMQKKLDTLNQGTKDKINLLSGAISNEQTAQSDYMSDLLSLMGDRTQTNINATTAAYA